MELPDELLVPLALHLGQVFFSVFTVIASANLPYLRVTCISKAKCLRIYVAQNFRIFKQVITLRTAFALNCSHVVFYTYIEVSRVSLSLAMVSVTYCLVILQYVKNIIIIIIIVIIISFMQGIYTYIPETNYVPREYSVAAILLLLFMVLITLVSVLNLLYFYISMRGAQYGCFLEFLDFMFSWYVAHVFSE